MKHLLLILVFSGWFVILFSAKSEQQNSFPWHRGVTSTVFWIGEVLGDGDDEDNRYSSWDDDWIEHYGGVDDPFERIGFYPAKFKPKENPFYLALPYNDFQAWKGDRGWEVKRRNNVGEIIPWYDEKRWTLSESMMKNKWVQIVHRNQERGKTGTHTCYGQVQDSGPFVYDDWEYVFGVNGEPKPPKNKDRASGSGLDVSPALRDCLHYEGINNDHNKVDWRFVDEKEVPRGPWLEIITRRQIYWRKP